MRSLVVYSSRTENTKKVAEAIYEVLPEEKLIFPVEKAPESSGFDFIAIGYWVNRGDVDALAQSYMKKLDGQTVGLFLTLGAYPDSEHGKKAVEKGKELCRDANVVGTFICQGKVDSKLLERMSKAGVAMTPEREARLREAAKHPNEEDLKNAKSTFLKILKEGDFL